ncbi:amylo-alpha-1,6-glucosidase [Rathayibacter sp. KR2-224]|uniref:amylo-alpha-1,6-glucosidase n=1 Tax=Rathayibacter sp. KR2-224 TaxID=3400913 RepID=UPI003C12AB9D
MTSLGTSTDASTTALAGEFTFDVRAIPFSRRGSWLDLSPVVGLHRSERDIHLVSHITGMHAVLRLSPRAGHEAVDASLTGTAASLRWEAAGGTVEAVFETTDVIRFRGRGLGMRFAEAATELTPFTGTYLYVDPIDGAAVYTSYETGRRYRVTAIEGELVVEGAEALGAAQRWVEARGDAWELVIEELESARLPYRRDASFDEIHDAVGAEFRDFLDAVAPWRTDDVPATAAAAYVLWSATVRPEGFLGREGVLMSKHWMDKVWSWDHCFNALALAEGHPRLALDQFLLPFDHQTDAGALPDSITHSEGLYNYVKPPIHGWAFARLRHSLPAELVEQNLPEVYRRLAAWSRFWLDYRRVPGHALPHYQHGNDSGWDNATTFDKDRVIESPDLAAFLLVQLRVLADLATELGGESAGEAAVWSAAAAEVEAGLEDLWRGDGYVAVGASSGTEAKRRSLLTLLPVVLGEALQSDAAAALGEDIRGHLTEWGLATEPVDSDDYEADGYWRGPIWAPSTVLIEDGLRRAGHTELADAVLERFLRLCEKSGFAENFDAVTGDGLRDRAYTWTASAYLLFARESTARTSPATTR